MKRSLLIILLACVINVLLVQQTRAQESKYKALFLYTFTKYINWAGKEKITIGVMGNSPVLLELQEINKRNDKTKFNLVKIAGANEVARCDMIFLPEAQSRNFSLIQSQIGTKPIVLVSDDYSLVEQGAEISFYLEGSKLKFAIHQQNIEASGVLVSSGLLALAKVI